MHGDESGSVDREHNAFGARLVEADPGRLVLERGRMVEGPFELDAEGREIVLLAIREHCRFRGWELIAAHVRSNHVHVVVGCEDEVKPERVMNELKAYASRALNR